MKGIKSLAWHPFLGSLFPVLFLFAYNSSYIPFSELLIPTLAVLFSSVLLLFTAKLFLPTWQKAGILVSTWWLLFFSYQAQRVQIMSWFGEASARHSYVLSVNLLLLLAIFLILRKSKSSLYPLSRILNVFAGILVIFPVSQILYFQGSHLVSKASIQPINQRKIQGLGTRPSQRPDIVYIILDGFGRPDNLQKSYNIDLEEFTKFLKAEGFLLPNQSSANYARTAASLASSLNFDYLQNLPGYHPKLTYLDLHKITEEATVLRLLRKEQYQLFGFATGFGNAELTKLATYLSPFTQPSPLREMLFSMSPLQIIEENAMLYRQYVDLKTKLFHYKEAPADKGKRHYELIQFALDNVPHYVGLENPSFVFADIFVGHPPFVFNEQGNYQKPTSKQENFIADGSDLIPSYPGGKEAYMQQYRSQLLFLNKRIMTLVERIKQQAKRPTIIILQGDHGPGANFHQEDATKSNLRERFAIFNAIYLSGKNAPPLPTDLTPVNTFRILLNQYFQTKLPLLPNRQFYSPGNEPGRFTEVTQILQKKENPL
ncbi:sulfatase-like hydrolase/transferase [Rufibacter hautae]|uniref:LTA synthase family protein n=1 Tax=Rufibacter hautae TaxID=2595005 RepID=A0A5B6TL69_9BACT|nr:sulfatase-like hydrolase/transferase [Rufibacter hautae]KAA3440179.1 LTA synthase family protein [Rufibacter hautae]